MENFDLIPLLDYISPDDYEVWYQVGMSLKHEGYSCEVWDKWSQGSNKYHVGECESKWRTFQEATGSVVTGAYITMKAKEGGWESRKVNKAPEFLAYDAVIGVDKVVSLVEDGYVETVDIPGPPVPWSPYEQIKTYINTLFQPDEYIGICLRSNKKEGENKYYPADCGYYQLTAGEILEILARDKDNITNGLGSYNPKAGAWVRFNPLDGKGVANANVADFRYALVECDDISLETQYSLIKQMQLPVAALVHSGGKSIHAIVKINAIDKDDYVKRVQFLYQTCEKSGLKIDTKNKNPSRLSRLPGIIRGDKKQYLIATNIGCESWEAWIDYIGSLDDDLPELTDFWSQLQDPPTLSPELIGGILREGNKMIITGESKAGKTCLSQEIAVCIAEGKPWLGRFPCEQGKVLYMNLEVEEASLFYRFRSIYLANGWEFNETTCRNIVPWNLRGYAVPLDKLAAKVIRRCKNTGPYKAIILDPLYKVQQGDENSAEAISTFCNALDKIAHETGAAIIYDHHHPKGAVGNKKVIDRGSGSGVFSRDADAICDLSFLDPDKVILETIGQQIADGEKPMQLSFVLRDFKDVEPINIFFKFPVHYIDTAGLLEGAAVEGSPEANIQNTNKKTAAEKRQIIEEAFEAVKQETSEEEFAVFSKMYKVANVSDKTLKKYIEENPLFDLTDGIVRRV